MQKTENIILIGMPGAGKSTIGVVLAKRLGKMFIDTDLVIQQNTGKLLPELIAELGADGFVELENKTLASLEVVNAIIATGGSAIFGEDGMAHLGETGKIVYLEQTYEVLSKRLGDLDARGVVTHKGTLREIYDEREPLYKKWADITIKCSDIIEENIDKCVDACK